MGSPILTLAMLTFLLLPLLASHSSAQYAGCPETYGVQVYPHEQYCDKFYKCVNGTLTEEICENGLVFDGYGDIHNHCNYNWAVDCGQEVPPLPQIPQTWRRDCLHSVCGGQP